MLMDMNIWILLAKTLAAVLLGFCFALVAVLLSEWLIPKEALGDFLISDISMILGTLSGAIGCYVGWKNTVDTLDQLLFQLLTRLFASWF